MRTNILSYLAGALLAGAAASALAQHTGSLSVTSSVTQTCTLSAISTLAFGAYDPVGANAAAALPGTGLVSINCTKNATGVTIDLDGGANVSGNQRRMKGATITTEFLNYGITQPATATPWTSCAGNTVWGSTVGGSGYTPTVTWDGTTVNDFTVCGSVPAAQNVSAQSYSDTVTVTVNF